MTFLAKHSRIDKISVCIGGTPTQGTYIIRNSFFSKKRLRIFSLVENRDD